MLSSSVMSSWTKRTRPSDVAIVWLRAVDGVELREVAKTVATVDEAAETSCLTSSRPRPREDPVTRYDAMIKAGGLVDIDATEMGRVIGLYVVEVGKQGRETVEWEMGIGSASGEGDGSAFRDTRYDNPNRTRILGSRDSNGSSTSCLDGSHLDLPYEYWLPTLLATCQHK